MKNDLSRLIEIDAIYGEISQDTAKAAKADMEGGAIGLIITFIISTIGLSASAGCLLAGYFAIGSSCGVIGVFFLAASRYFKREMQKSEDIYLAYTQRDKLRELRGDINVAIDLGLEKPKMKRLKR